MITLVVRYRAREGAGDTVAATLARHMTATRREPGCVQFVVGRDPERPDEFVLFEQYVDEPALELHRSSPHFKEYVAGTVAPLLEEREARRLEALLPEPE